MKYTLRGLAALAALLVCLMACPTASAAASATVTIGTASARPGDTVTVPVSVSAVSDLVGIELHVGFDDTVLEYVDSTVEGVALQMNMATANQAASAPDEVWLSAMTLDGVSGEGVAYTMTFRVKETAPNGMTALTFTDHKHMLLTGLEMTELPLKLKNGGIDVQSEAAPVSTAAPTEAAPTDAPLPDTQGVQIVLDEQGQPVTRNDGQTVTLSPPNTVVNLMGAQVTDADGEAVRLPNVAVMVDQVSANPNETVDVAVSLSPIAAMSSMEITVTYDPAALRFDGGDAVGFTAERLRIRETEAGTVVMQAEYTAGMSGDGDIAVLHFTVKDTARAGVYRLGLNPTPRVMIGEAVLGVQSFAGEIGVLSDGANADSAGGMPWVWIAVGVAAVAVVTVIVMLRRKGGAAKPPKASSSPRTTDVSGDDL